MKWKTYLKYPYERGKSFQNTPRRHRREGMKERDHQRLEEARNRFLLEGPEGSVLVDTLILDLGASRTMRESISVALSYHLCDNVFPQPQDTTTIFITSFLSKIPKECAR